MKKHLSLFVLTFLLNAQPVLSVDINLEERIFDRKTLRRAQAAIDGLDAYYNANKDDLDLALNGSIDMESKLKKSIAVQAVLESSRLNKLHRDIQIRYRADKEKERLARIQNITAAIFEADGNTRKTIATSSSADVKGLLDKNVIDCENSMIKDEEGYSFLMRIINGGNMALVSLLHNENLLPKSRLIRVLSEDELCFTQKTKSFLQQLYDLQDSEFSKYLRDAIDDGPWKGYFYVTPTRPAVTGIAG